MATKLHEVLPVQKTLQSAWNQLLTSTKKKFKSQANFFEGHSKSLKMIEESPENENIQDQSLEEKPVITTVLDTLDYALDIFGKSEDLQYQKNKANQSAVGTVMWKGEVLLKDMPVDQLLGLEARLGDILNLYMDIPTLDATKNWIPDENIGNNVWKTEFPEVTTKTEKVMIPVILVEATDNHPAQVDRATKDKVVGKFTTTKRSGAATAIQKANGIKMVGDFLVEVKQARMRANTAEVTKEKVSKAIIEVLLSPFK